MRSAEKVTLVLAVVVFITAVGSGVFDVYIQNFEEGVDVILDLGKHSTQALVALAALVTAAVTLSNSARGRKKRKR